MKTGFRYGSGVMVVQANLSDSGQYAQLLICEYAQLLTCAVAYICICAIADVRMSASIESQNRGGGFFKEKIIRPWEFARSLVWLDNLGKLVL